MSVKTSRFSAKLLAAVAALSLMGSGVAAADDSNSGDATNVSVSSEASATPEAQLLDSESDGATDEVTPSADESSLDAEPTEEASDDAALEDGSDESVSDSDSAEDEVDADIEEDVTVDDEEAVDDEEEVLDDEGGAAKNVVPDKKLRQCINSSALGYATDDARAITAAKLKKITKKVDCNSAPARGSISSLQGLQYLIKAPSLSLIGVSDKASLAPLSKLKNSKMTYLYISGDYKNKKKQKFPNLSGLKNLDYLTLMGINFTDISNISKNKKLRNVSISSCSVSNVKPLAKLPNIESIGLYGNNIKDISPLANLKKLYSLYVTDNKLTSIPKRSVKDKHRQAHLSIKGNNIKNFKNGGTWTLEGKQDQIVALKGTVKSGKTTINISSLRDTDGSLPKKVYLAENNYGYLKPLTAHKGSILNGGKTARFSKTLKNGDWIYVEGKKNGGWYVKLTTGVKTKKKTTSGSVQKMYRLYNRVSHEHLYTNDWNEVKVLSRGDWNYEGVGWVAPKTSKTPVYRLYNPGLGDHHYTMSWHEVKELTSKHGWKYERIGWYSDDKRRVKVYRQFNPGLRVGSHNYTADKHEYDVNNARNGWRGEGTAWYAISRK